MGEDVRKLQGGFFLTHAVVMFSFGCSAPVSTVDWLGR